MCAITKPTGAYRCARLIRFRIVIGSSTSAPESKGAPSTQSAQARSTGVQRRGAERVKALLIAAEELLAEQGYEGATLKAIGKRAGIPTASVYHYFADRFQIEAELMARHTRALDEQIILALDTLPPCTLREAVDAVIDVVVGYFRAYPSIVQLWFPGRGVSFEVPADDSGGTRTAHILRILIDRGLVRPDTPLLAVHLAYEAGDRIFEVAFRMPAGDDATIDEARRMVTAYLATYSP